MTPRSYTSSIRDAQVEQTRAHLMDTARTLLIQGGADALTLPKLAQAANVSAPTVYRHFPTIDELFRAFLEWLRPRVGQTSERLLRSPEQLPSLPLENFPLFEAESAVLRPLMESREWNRIRVASQRDRARSAAKLLRADAPDWSDAQLEAMSGAIWVLGSPQVWRWLRDTWAIDNDEAAQASSWAMRTLLEALARGPRASHTSAPRAQVKASKSKPARAHTSSRPKATVTRTKTRAPRSKP
jgi:AcrR family transcriptional regulator